MSKFKVGDKVRLNGRDTYDSVGLVENAVTVVTEVNSTGVTVRGLHPNDSGHVGDDWFFYFDELELVDEAPKGTFERLLIESLPQGGYKVTAAGPTFNLTHNELAAFTTLPEAVAFVGRNMK